MVLSERAKEISKLILFSKLKEEELNQVSFYLFPKTYQRKEIIFSETDPADYLYFLSSGKVRIFKTTPQGKEITIEIIIPGEFFGGLGILAEEHPANAQAMERSKIYSLPRKSFFIFWKVIPKWQEE